MKLPETFPLEEMSYVFSFTIFFTAAYFLPALSPPLQNFHVILPTKTVSPLSFFPLSLFYLSLQISVALFLAEFRWPAAFSLSFSCSIFQICGQDNYSKLNTLENTDVETISAFRFRLY